MRLIRLSFQTCFFFVFMSIFLPVISSAQDSKTAEKVVKIGLLIPDSKSLAAKNGAELAIRGANERGGVNRLTFQLVVRSMEGPWGTGSKEAVSMIFDEKVVAIMGSHDGRNAHLVEQVSAKSKVVFLSAWTSDPTLSQAFVPWFFNCVYNDLQQAEALIEEIYKRRKLSDIAVISDKSYDSESSLKSFLKNAKSAGIPEPLQFSYDNANPDINNILIGLKSSETDCIIMFVQPPASLKIIEQLKLNGIDLTVFGSLALLNENADSGQGINHYENAIFVSEFNMSDKKSSSFIKDYSKTYGELPGAVAACAFDGMNILIEAIRKSGPDRDKIQGSMSETKYEGVTGIIQFDEKGNRLGAAGLVQIHNGIPVTLTR